MYIRAHIEDKLAPGRCVKLHPYKVNIYGEEGFFKPHVDNPSDHNMMGTLVICLPSSHKSGELLVNHDGSRLFQALCRYEQNLVGCILQRLHS